MATRQETNRRREALRGFLREQGRRHAGAPVPAPPVRELAEKHELSANVVCTVLQELTEEGVLHTVPRVGTFIGAPTSTNQDLHLFLLTADANDMRHRQMRVGFEDRIATRGGAVMVMTYEDAVNHHAKGELPSLAGVFDLAYLPYGERAWATDVARQSTPHVRFHSHDADTLGYDTVSFDDVDGARQATRHLISQGHKRIAFLALHSPQHDSGLLEWSEQRELGWQQTLAETGLPMQGLAFHPGHDANTAGTNEAAAAREAARGLILNRNITAVVAANDNAAEGLIQTLRAANMPNEMWPAIVSFDGESGLGTSLVTSLRLPWEEIGRVAADLIWERRNGVLSGAPVHRQVPMRLIPRLTSRREWLSNSSRAVLAASI
jgi:DNA-binding LacI/PurR family transcriptional regulator